MSDVFKALADPTRREILRMLAHNPRTVNEISSRFDMSRPAVSKHLKILKDSQLMRMEFDVHDARQRNCYIQLEALQEVDEYIRNLERFWKNKLTGLGKFLDESADPPSEP